MSALKRAWTSAWFGPVSGIRVWLMVRATALVLALDAWVLMIERGGRYGAGGFNVAHFAWLDALQPLPSASLYVGLIISCGVLSLLIALGIARGIAMVMLTLGYTYSWAMSQLDSYQHHVFISWILLCFCVTPWLSAREVFKEGREICAWGYRLLIALTTILYIFTGISKAEPEWLSGSVLKRINAAGGHLEPFREFLTGLGADEATFWTLSGHSVVAVQWVIAAAWLSLMVFGERAGVWVRVGRLGGVLCAIAFHIGAEIVGLRIGWFSWYMLGMTLIAFFPAELLARLAAPVGERIERVEAAFHPPKRRSAAASWILLNALAASALLIVGLELDLPGTAESGALWALLSVLLVAAEFKRSRRVRYTAFAISLCALTLTLSIEQGRARYDFYRFVGGDALRRRQLNDALVAYGRANTYAPEGEGRWKKVAQTQHLLRTQPTLKK